MCTHTCVCVHTNPHTCTPFSTSQEKGSQASQRNSRAGGAPLFCFQQLPDHSPPASEAPSSASPLSLHQPFLPTHPTSQGTGPELKPHGSGWVTDFRLPQQGSGLFCELHSPHPHRDRTLSSPPTQGCTGPTLGGQVGVNSTESE